MALVRHAFGRAQWTHRFRWLDTRNAANNTDSQLFYSYSTDGGTTWSPNVAVSNSFNPSLGYPNNQKIGDYITIVSDNTGGNVAYAATFNDNPNAVGGHEQDVYYVRVSPTGGPTPTPTATRYPNPHADAYCNAACYSHAYDYAQSLLRRRLHGYSYATTNTDASNEAVAQRSSYSATEAESLIPG